MSTSAREAGGGAGRQAAAPASRRAHARMQPTRRASWPQVIAISFGHGQGTQQNVGWQVLYWQGRFKRGCSGWTLATANAILAGRARRTRSPDRASHRCWHEGSTGHAWR
jgi:hypothetical protein